MKTIIKDIYVVRFDYERRETYLWTSIPWKNKKWKEARQTLLNEAIIVIVDENHY